jgi:peptidoglycan/xylan/chitin deacetylase (PgdA/CDA1 family)
MKKVWLFLFLVILFSALGFWRQKEIKKDQPVGEKKISKFVFPLPTFLPTPTLKPVPTPISYVNDGFCQKVPILMYHHVNSYAGSQKTSVNLTVSTETFASQLDYLIQRGYTVISFDDLLAALNSQMRLGRVVLVTFDDGYEDNYREAFPLLRSRNLKATIFIASGLVESGPSYLTWSQIREMQASGLITLGNHTWSHPSLVAKSRDFIFKEIKTAQDQILSFTGQPAAYFAYPYGGETAVIESVLAELGFKGAVVTYNRFQCEKKLYQLGRIRVGNVPLAAYGL